MTVEDSDYAYVSGSPIKKSPDVDGFFSISGGVALTAPDASSYAYRQGTPLGLDDSIVVGQLSSEDTLNYVGDTARMQLEIWNFTSSAEDYTVAWYEDGVQFTTETHEVDPDSVYYYNEGRSKSSAGVRTYQGDTSNELEIAWITVRPKNFEADKYILQPGETTTLSIDIENPSASDEDVKVEFLEEGAVVSSETKTVGSGATVGFSTTRTKDYEIKREYEARVTVVSSGISGTTSGINVEWTTNAILADTGGGLTAIQPVYVSTFGSFYDYYDEEAHHAYEGNEAVVLYDGDRVAIAVTYGTGVIGSGYHGSWEFGVTKNAGDLGTWVVEDDPFDDTGTYGGHTPQGGSGRFSDENTDGGVYVIPSGADLSFSSSPSVSFANLSGGSPIRIQNNLGT